jgi:hypothetical protein
MREFIFAVHGFLAVAADDLHGFLLGDSAGLRAQRMWLWFGVRAPHADGAERKKANDRLRVPVASEWMHLSVGGRKNCRGEIGGGENVEIYKRSFR